MNQEKIGLFIREVRKSKQLTQQEVANQLGITAQAVSKWERGKSLPDASLMTDLCQLLNISLNELLSGDYLTSEHYQEKAEQNLKDLIFPHSHLKSIRLISSLLLAIGIALFGFPFGNSGETLSLWTRLGFHSIGVCIWIIAVYLQLKLDNLKNHPFTSTSQK